MNINKLKGKIVERGYNMSSFFMASGLNKSTLYRKFSTGGKDITIEEALKITNVLKLSNEEALAIFFDRNVA